MFHARMRISILPSTIIAFVDSQKISFAVCICQILLRMTWVFVLRNMITNVMLLVRVFLLLLPIPPLFLPLLLPQNRITISLQRCLKLISATFQLCMRRLYSMLRAFIMFCLFVHGSFLSGARCQFLILQREMV